MTNSTTPSIPPPVIPYRSQPRGLAGRFALHYATFLAALFALNVLVGFLALFVVRIFKNIFHDFRVPLSTFTAKLILFTDFLYEDYQGHAILLAVIALLPFLLALLTTFVEPSARRRKRLLWIVLIQVIACLVLVAIGAASIWSDYAKLIKSVSH